MNKELICPDCGNENLTCSATISAVLRTKRHDDGGMDYELSEWEDIEQIHSYDCQECGFGFIGDEDEFLEQAGSTTEEQATG